MSFDFGEWQPCLTCIGQVRNYFQIARIKIMRTFAHADADLDICIGFFFVPALLRDFSLCWDHLEVVQKPHTCQALPCGSRAGADLGSNIVNALLSLAPCNLNCEKVFPLLRDRYTIPKRYQTHRPRVKTFISPHLYLQATTAGWIFALLCII